jgi:hypothetical protein
MHQAQKKLHARVTAAAGAAFAQRKVVTPIDVLVGVGWLQPSLLEEWRKGRVPYLEAVVTAGLGKISKAMKYFRDWAQHSGLKPTETVYRRRSHRLRFSKSGDENIERAYRTHWTLPSRPRQRPQLQHRAAAAPNTAGPTEPAGQERV